MTSTRCPRIVETVELLPAGMHPPRIFPLVLRHPSFTLANSLIIFAQVFSHIGVFLRYPYGTPNTTFPLPTPPTTVQSSSVTFIGQSQVHRMGELITAIDTTLGKVLCSHLSIPSPHNSALCEMC